MRCSIDFQFFIFTALTALKGWFIGSVQYVDDWTIGYMCPYNKINIMEIVIAHLPSVWVNCCEEGHLDVESIWKNVHKSTGVTSNEKTAYFKYQ